MMEQICLSPPQIVVHKIMTKLPDSKQLIHTCQHNFVDFLLILNVSNFN